MAGLPLARAQAIANSEMGVSPAATRILRLYSVAPTTTTAGTEISGSGYAAQTIVLGTADSTGTCNQTADINFPAATATWPNIVAWAITDNAGTTMFTFSTFGSLPVVTGSIVQFLIATNPIAVQYS